MSSPSNASLWALRASFAEIPGTGVDDLLEGGRGDDTLNGLAGADTLIAGAGADLLFGGTGRDALFGGDGDDTLFGQGGQDRLDGGSGRDTALYTDNTTSVAIDLAAGTVTFPGQPWGAETLVSIENLVTGSGADWLRGTAGANVLDGGLGADTIDGRRGSDVVSFASHAGGVGVEVDLLHQRAVVVATGVTDVLRSIEGAIGGSGHDRLLGNGLANRLDGAGGDDFIRGAGGDDTILLSAGDDTLGGGAGTDTLVWNPGYDDFDGLDFELIVGDDGFTVFEIYSGDVAPDSLIDLRHGIAIDYTATGISQITRIENVTTGVGNDVVIGDDGANVIAVGHGANYVDGGGGDDRITGSNAVWEYLLDRSFHADTREAYEVLWGGSGDDTMIGGTRMNGEAGDDLLVAGWAGNVLSGGAGADTFEFSTEHAEVGFFAAVLAQTAQLVDFDAAEGDRVLVGWTSVMGPDLPEFAGYVPWLELGARQFCIDGDTLHVALAASTDGEIDFYDGLRIHAPGIQAEDVFFV